MGKMQEKYLEEFEKYKHIVITPGNYKLKNAVFKYTVISVDEQNNKVALMSEKGVNVTKTLHWARKNLQPATE